MGGGRWVGQGEEMEKMRTTVIEQQEKKIKIKNIHVQDYKIVIVQKSRK